MTEKLRSSGMEVPIIAYDSIKWFDVSVSPSSSSSFNDTISSHERPQPLAPLTEDYASCSFVGGDPSLYLICRIHKSLPNSLELFELSSSQQFPILGLRFNFPHPLSPFAFISKSQINHASGNACLLYAMTVSGLVFRLKVSKFSAYESCPVFPHQDIAEFDLSDYGPITSIAANAGCFVVGRADGSVISFQLDILHHTDPGFAHELRDDSGIGRLWGLVSRGRTVGAVQDLVLSEVQGKKLVFVLHSDGIIRVWDLLSHSRIFSHALSNQTSEGIRAIKLSVGETRCSSGNMPLAILYRHNMDDGGEVICVYNLRCSFGDKTLLSLDSSLQKIQLEGGGCIDIKLASDNLWILKDNTLVLHKLFHTDDTLEEGYCYTMQEEFVADQLFQSSECSSDDLLSVIHSMITSTKDQIVPFISSIFLRRLLHPGVRHNTVMRATLLDYNRHLTDSEFQSLTVDGLRNEIVSLIEIEGVAESPLSIFYGWKNFCARYFDHWCKNNMPYGLFVQCTTGAVVLLRRNLVSVFRSEEKVELLIGGSSDELGELMNTELEHEILLEVLKCIINIRQQLGETASAIFYESVVGTPILSSDEIVQRLLKILETGYNSSITRIIRSDLGTDVAKDKEFADHKNFRKYSINMLLSLHAIIQKATSWDKVLNVIESYLQFLVPSKINHNFDAETIFLTNTSIIIQATSQIAKVMFESALDILLFISYLVNIGGQISVSESDISRIELELIPMVQEIVFEWLTILFLAITPSQSPSIEDFSSQLSLLQIDCSSGKRSWNEKLGKCDFTLAYVLLLNIQSSSQESSHISPKHLFSPQEVNNSVWDFTSWIIWGKSGEESTSFLRRSTQLALILLRHGQYDAVESMLTIEETNLQKEKIFKRIQESDGDWCVLQHLLGCCLLAQAQCGLHGILKEKKVCEAIRCFFRASSGQGACRALQCLSHEGHPHLGFNPDGSISPATWKLYYYQWVMQIFEQYDISEGACGFALAALEQVDEALSLRDDSSGSTILNESASTIKGRLWANVFKFTLDLNHLHDAYCAIISNPDEESKYICLRRLIIVLYEHKATKFLCDGQLPFIGIAQKIEQELAWKAARSDVLAKPNPYKLLYAFEMQRHNWRRAASYMYLYTACLKTEPVPKDQQMILLTLQERLNGLSAAINALHLVHPAYAWIDPLIGGNSFLNEHHPTKKAKKMVKEQTFSNDMVSRRLHSNMDIEKLEKEFVLTMAEYSLSVANVKWSLTGTQKAPSDLVDLLVQNYLYDIAFTVLLKFWKGSELKRQMERVFSAISLNCCPQKAGSLWVGNDSRKQNLLLTLSKDELVVHGSPENVPATQQYKASNHWETLELYLEKYKAFHGGLPVVVAETLLRTDPHMELPLWLVHIFKDGKEKTWAMTGKESSPASLFQLYVDYGRYTEATNLLLERLESFASMRPVDIISRKSPFAMWFPYATIERLWFQLEKLVSSGHMVEQCEKLKKLLRGALLNHLKLLKVDSDDAISFASS